MPNYRIWNRDFITVVGLIQVDTMFADPPDNIGLGYDQYDDRMEMEHYIDFLNTVIEVGIECANTSYISFNSRWMTEMGYLLRATRDVYDVEVRWLVQGFTFGQHRKTDLANNFRPIVRIRKPDAPLFPERTRIESDRMKIGDKRANPKGRVPGDVWFSDFLEYSRVVGNSKQRRRWHPTQLHEGLVEDCLLMSTPIGGCVFDPFMGTGTTLRVCIENDWDCYTCDISRDYCQKVSEELGFWPDPPTGKGNTWVMEF